MEQRQRIKTYNDAYRAKFGFTFVICARENKVLSIMEGLTKRLSASRRVEIENGIGQVKKIARLRAMDIMRSTHPNYKELFSFFSS